MDPFLASFHESHSEDVFTRWPGPDEPARMGDTHNRISEQADLEWLLQRTRVICGMHNLLMQCYSLGSSRMVVPLPSSRCLAEGNRISRCEVPPPPELLRCNFSFSYFRLHTGCQFRLLLLQFQHLLVPLQVISHTVIVAANRVKALHLHWASKWKCKGCDRASEATRQVYLPASTAQHNTCISIVIPIPICFFVDLSMVCCGVVWCGVVCQLYRRVIVMQ